MGIEIVSTAPLIDWNNLPYFPEPLPALTVPSCKTFNCTRSFTHPRRTLRTSYVDEF